MTGYSQEWKAARDAERKAAEDEQRARELQNEIAHQRRRMGGAI